jgi:hypothetical protein
MRLTLLGLLLVAQPMALLSQRPAVLDSPLGGVVEDALRAQVFLPGGCFGELASTVVRQPEAFPAVTVITATCLAEHGDTLFATAGVDTAGVVYVLDSPSAWAFLLRRHRPMFSDTTDFLEYTREGLVYSGEISAAADVIQDASELPGEIPAGVVRRARRYRSRVAPTEGGRRLVEMLLYDNGKLISYSVTLMPDGRIFADRRNQLWTRPPRRQLH